MVDVVEGNTQLWRGRRAEEKEQGKNLEGGGEVYKAGRIRGEG